MIRIAKKSLTAETDAPARADVVALSLTKTVSSLLDRAIAQARDAMIATQNAAGYWLFELEADCTIPAEYIMMMHFLDEIDAELEAKIAVYLRAHQQPSGGWPLYHGGEFNMSCTVKAYYALKLAGDDVKAPHMARARAAILERGGAARSNVFTRIALALFGQIPWRGVPYIPVEIMLLPKWFFFHLDKVSYWSRTVMVPLFILCTKKPLAKNPSGRTHPRAVHDPSRDRARLFSRCPPGRLARQGAAGRGSAGPAHRPLHPHLDEGTRHTPGGAVDARAAERRGRARRHLPRDGECAGGDDDSGVPGGRSAPRDREAGVAETPGRGSLERLLPALRLPRVGYGPRPALAMQEAGCARSSEASARALDWLQAEQILDEPGDWQVDRPDLNGRRLGVSVRQ